MPNHKGQRLRRLLEAIVAQYDIEYRSLSGSDRSYWNHTGFIPIGLEKKWGIWRLINPTRCDTCNSRTDLYELRVRHQERPTAKPDLPLMPITPFLWQWVEGKVCPRCADFKLIVMRRVQDDFAGSNMVAKEVTIADPAATA